MREEDFYDLKKQHGEVIEALRNSAMILRSVASGIHLYCTACSRWRASLLEAADKADAVIKTCELTPLLRIGPEPLPKKLNPDGTLTEYGKYVRSMRG